jgi:hypothetical protein
MTDTRKNRNCKPVIISYKYGHSDKMIMVSVYADVYDPVWKSEVTGRAFHFLG